MTSNAERRPEGAALKLISRPADDINHSTGEAADTVVDLIAPDSSSWIPIHLGDIVAGLRSGTRTTPKPTVGRLVDGSYWLYPGRTNCIAGQPGCGKTWTALSAVASELEAGNNVIYVDLEDNEDGIVGRLMSMGVPDAVIADPLRFAYVHPDVRFDRDAKAEFRPILAALHPSLVVIDSTGESMALESCDPNSDDAVARWFQAVPTYIAKRGPAVLLLDHLPKANSGASAPIGSQRKRAALSGVQMIQEVRRGQSFARGRAGEASLTCTKDRSGHFVTGDVAARLVVNPNGSMTDGSGCEVSLVPAGKWAPTLHMVAISEYMAGIAPAVATTNAICSAVSGKKSTLLDGLAVLVANNYLDMTPGPRNSTEYTYVSSYRNGDQITVPDGLGGTVTAASGPPTCREHEWHKDQPCDPEWCHPGDFGGCNRTEQIDQVVTNRLAAVSGGGGHPAGEAWTNEAGGLSFQG